MDKTAKNLIEYAIGQHGKPYWYATYGQISNKDLWDRKKKQYPKYYTATDFGKQYGHKVHDCVGLIKGFMWSTGEPDALPKYNSNGFPDVSANGLYSYCKTKGTMTTFPNEPGVAVFFNGHVGVYIGNGEVEEARGHAYGVVRTKLANRNWTHWGYIPGVKYSVATEPVAEKKDPKLEVGSKGEYVKKVQEMLLKLGFELPKYGADGDYGTETKNAVMSFQFARGIVANGIVDIPTYEALIATLEESESDDEDDTEMVEIVTAGTWNVRSGPSTTDIPIGYVHFGDTKEYVATASNGWICIFLGDERGLTGWVSPKCAKVL